MATEAPSTGVKGGFVSSQKNTDPGRGNWGMDVALSGSWEKKERAPPPWLGGPCLLRLPLSLAWPEGSEFNKVSV